MYALCISFGLIRVSFDVQIESGEWMKEWRSGTSVIWWSVTLIWHRFYIYSMIDTLQKVSRWSLTNSIIKSRTPWYTSFFFIDLLKSEHFVMCAAPFNKLLTKITIFEVKNEPLSSSAIFPANEWCWNYGSCLLLLLLFCKYILEKVWIDW